MANKFDFGLPTGLAYRHNFQQDISNEARLTQMRRQAEIDAKNEARLFADEWDTLSLRNPFEAKGLNGFLEGHFKDMGKWLQEHPNFRSDPMEFTQYKNKFVKPIKDNEWVRADLRFQEESKLARKYFAEKGADHPHTLEMMEKLDNAKKYGNIDGEEAYKREGRKEFTFASPYDGFKPLDVATKAMQTENPSPESVYEDTYGGVWYQVPEDRAKGRLKALVNDAYGEYEKWFNEMPEDERLGDNVVDHLYEATKGSLDSKYAGNSSDIFRAKKDGTGKKGAIDPNKSFYEQTVTETLLARKDEFPDLPASVSANSEGIYNMMANKEGKVAVGSDAKLMVATMTDQGIRTDKQSLGLTGNYDVVIGKGGEVNVHLIKDDQGYERPFAEAWVTVGENQALQVEDHLIKQGQKWIADAREKDEKAFTDKNGEPIEIDNIFDFKGWNNLSYATSLVTGSSFIDEMNDVVFGDSYKSSIQLQADPDDPNKVKGIQFKMLLPVPQNPGSQIDYDNTMMNKYKAGTGPTGGKPRPPVGTEVKLGTGEMVELIGYDHNGKMIWK